MVSRCVAGVIAICLLLPEPARPQSVSRDDLLMRAAAYVHQFVDAFSNVVAEELLLQEITVPRRKRSIRSDYLFTRFPGDQMFTAFRDVFEVDGKQVRDHEERLMKLFLSPSSDMYRRAADIQREGARHNLLDIGTLNNPLLAIAFLQDVYQPRFRFTLAGIEKNLGPRVRTIQFQEIKGPTLIKGNSNSDVFARGLAWIEEDTGRVVKTELRFGSSRAPISIVTTFRFDETLGIDVPMEMRDWYPDGTGELRGVATYGRFRRFQIKTEETLK